MLYEIVLAAEPLKDVPEASPVPPLLNVTAFVTDPAEVALVAVPAVVANNELEALVAKDELIAWEAEVAYEAVPVKFATVKVFVVALKVNVELSTLVVL